MTWDAYAVPCCVGRANRTGLHSTVSVMIGRDESDDLSIKNLRQPQKTKQLTVRQITGLGNSRRVGCAAGWARRVWLACHDP